MTQEGKFKVGDRVVCIEDDSWSESGWKGIVVQDDHDETYRILYDNGKTYWVTDDQIEHENSEIPKYNHNAYGYQTCRAVKGKDGFFYLEPCSHVHSYTHTNSSGNDLSEESLQHAIDELDRLELKEPKKYLSDNTKWLNTIWFISEESKNRFLNGECLENSEQTNPIENPMAQLKDVIPYDCYGRAEHEEWVREQEFKNDDNKHIQEEELFNSLDNIMDKVRGEYEREPCSDMKVVVKNGRVIDVKMSKYTKIGDWWCEETE